MITDNLGRLISKQVLTALSGANKIALPNVNRGMYHVSIISGTQVESTSYIK